MGSQTIVKSAFQCEEIRFPRVEFSLHRPSKPSSEKEDEPNWDLSASSWILDIKERRIVAACSLHVSVNNEENHNGEGAESEAELMDRPLFSLVFVAVGVFSRTFETPLTEVELREFVKMLRISGITQVISVVRPAIRSLAFDAGGFEVVLPSMDISKLDDAPIFEFFKKAWEERKGAWEV